MKDYTATGDYYVIGHLVQFTGLTDRTIRGYIASGILRGEKINGLWHFTPEQVGDFFRHPAVRPSILAKNNALVYDFLLDAKKEEARCCIVLDLPGEDGRRASDYFCGAISQGEYRDLRFSFDGVAPTPRVILTGPTPMVLELVNGFYNQTASREHL